MRLSKRYLAILGPFLSLLFLICFRVFAAESQLLMFKPHPRSLEYNLAIKAHSVVDMNSAGQGRIFEDHDDMITLTQKVSEIDGGLLGIDLTVKMINWEEHGPTNGKRLKREEIIGNSHRTKINLLGKIEEINSFPHFGSNEFFSESLDGPALDHWRIMSMLYPQFPLKLVGQGESWEIKDEFSVTPAEALAVAGIMPIRHNFEMVIRRTIKYTLIDYVQRAGYNTARIGFEATFRTDGEVQGATEGDYTDGSGSSSGEFYFAPEEGILVQASFKENVIERKAKDGHFKYYLGPDISLWAEAYDQTSVPFIWRTDKTVDFRMVNEK